MKERDGKKIDGPHVYFSKREGKINTMWYWYLVNFWVVVIHTWQKYLNKVAYVIIKFVMMSFQIHSIKSIYKNIKIKIASCKGLYDCSHYIKTNWRWEYYPSTKKLFYLERYIYKFSHIPIYIYLQLNIVIFFQYHFSY